MRYFIHDLHNQLDQLQSSFIQSLNGQKRIILYRGQTISKNQFDETKENFDGFISMNSFLLTTEDEEVAIVYSGNGKMANPDEISVIYEMLIDTNSRSTPFAKIKTFNPHEEEILFPMGSVFRIGKVKELRERVYCVKLTVVDRDDELRNKLTKHLDS